MDVNGSLCLHVDCNHTSYIPDKKQPTRVKGQILLVERFLQPHRSLTFNHSEAPAAFPEDYGTKNMLALLVFYV